jgi:hypothetical protein
MLGLSKKIIGTHVRTEFVTQIGREYFVHFKRRMRNGGNRKNKNYKLIQTYLDKKFFHVNHNIFKK